MPESWHQLPFVKVEMVIHSAMFLHYLCTFAVCIDPTFSVRYALLAKAPE